MKYALVVIVTCECHKKHQTLLSMGTRRARETPACGHDGEDTMTTKRRAVSARRCMCIQLEASQINSFRCHGFLVVPSFLTSEELMYLRLESDELFAALHSDAAIATQTVIDQGCVLDAMTNSPMADDSEARIDKRAYIAARREAMPVAISSNAEDIIRRLLFERLPQLVGRLLESDGESHDDIYFFNEHYVVKPPHSEVEFRWHRDDDEQLAMCVHRDLISPYVSVWCALDDISDENGPLRFVPLNSSLHGENDPSELEKYASAPVLAQAGTAVLFFSNVWHCSSSNTSGRSRRAFYAQYSSERITATAKDKTPLSFAIPCEHGRFGAASTNDQ